MDDSIQNLLNYINKDLKKLENSNLRLANKTMYRNLKESFELLKKKILDCDKVSEIENFSLNQNTLYSKKKDYAFLSAKLDFYMNFKGGNREVIDYQVNQILENLKKIINDINEFNYNEKKLELDNAISFYQKSEIDFINYPQIENLILNFNYQVYKYSIEDFIIEKTNIEKTNIEKFIPLVIEDIDNLMSDSEVCGFIKEEMQKYALDTKLIKENFTKIIILINLGNNKTIIGKERLNGKLSATLYQRIDITIPTNFEYIKDDCEKSKNDIIGCIKTGVKYTTFFAIIIDAIKYDNDKIRLGNYCPTIPALYEIFRLAFKDTTIDKENIIKMIHCLQNVKFNEFNDFIKLFEYLIINIGLENLDLWMAIYDECPYVRYDMDCSVILHFDELDPKEVSAYFLHTKNEHILRRIIKSRNAKFFNKDFITFLEENIEFATEIVTNIVRINGIELAIGVLQKIENKKALQKIIYELKDKNLQEELLVKFGFIVKSNENNMENMNNKKALEFVIENPKNIVSLFTYLDMDDIINLSEDTLNIFCEYYAQNHNLNKENISDFGRIVLNSEKDSGKKELLIYIMHKGLINLEMLSYIKNVNNFIIKEAIKNVKDKLHRPTLIFYLMKNVKDLDKDYFDLLFLTQEEIREMNENNQNLAELKLKKYYADLLRILPFVNENIKLRIAITISKSNIKEYILYLASNFPEYIEILLENTQDQELYQLILEKYNDTNPFFNGTGVKP